MKAMKRFGIGTLLIGNDNLIAGASAAVFGIVATFAVCVRIK